MSGGYYFTVPSSDAEKVFGEKPAYYSTSTPLIGPQRPKVKRTWCHFLMPLKKRLWKSLFRSRTRVIKLLCTLGFFIVSIFFILRFIYNPIRRGLPVKEATSLFKSIPSISHIETHYSDHSKLSNQVLTKWTRDRWMEFGVADASIKTYWPLLNYPDQKRLAIITGPQDLLYESNTTTLFHPYSANGNVTGSVVYANYGRFEDFQFLAIRGVQLNGTIALIRHGEIDKGMQVKMAQDVGCIGVLLYHDTSDVKQGDTSVLFSSYGKGDPLTPGYPAYKNTTHRISHQNVTSLPKIPSLSIASDDALALFKATEGFGIEGNGNWLGGLCDVLYYSGPSVAKVNLVNINSYEVQPIHNVIGKIQGHVEPDRSIIIGASRNSPSSSVVLMELVRTIGILQKKGWKPKRSLIIASWDAQQYASVGSTEWVEDHASWLTEKAVAYLDINDVIGNQFDAQSSQLLYQLLYDITKQVNNPQTNTSVFDTWKLERDTTGGRLVEILGADHNYPAFSNFLGISSISLGFGSSMENKETSIKPLEFEYHQTLTQIWGLILYHLTTDQVLPMNIEDYTKTISQELAKIQNQSRCSTLPYLFSTIHTLSSTSRYFQLQTNRLTKQFAAHKRYSKKLLKNASRVNDCFIQFERALIDPIGISPDRCWYKHVVFGPELNTGRPQAFPGLKQAMDKDDCDTLNELEKRVGQHFLDSEKILQRQLKSLEEDSLHE